MDVNNFNNSTAQGPIENGNNWITWRIVIIFSIILLLLCFGIIYMLFAKSSKSSSNKAGVGLNKSFQVHLTYESLPIADVAVPIIRGSGVGDLTLCGNQTVYKSIQDALRATRKVCVLALDNQGLSSLPADITKLQDVQFLFLRYNKFTTFPHEILQLKNLRGLDISNNSISAIPADTSKLAQLIRIVLTGNPISSSEQNVIRSNLGPVRIITF